MVFASMVLCCFYVVWSHIVFTPGDQCTSTTSASQVQGSITATGVTGGEVKNANVAGVVYGGMGNKK